MTELHPLEASLAAAWPPASWCDLHCLIAVSGGADSVALLLAAHAVQRASGASGRVLAAHFNHQLRSAANSDQEFVSALCQDHGIAFEIGLADGLSEAASDGLEAAAREQRYAFLKATASRLGARWIATGHTADDQAETILHRILRGTGIAGLAGIPRYRPLNEAIVVVRPMLAVSRSEILDYLASRGQSFCEDETNQQSQFTRNRLRNELLPLLRDRYNPAINRALLRMGALAEETQAIVDAAAAELRNRCLLEAPNGVCLAIDRLREAPSLLVRELFKSIWKQQHWDELEMGYQQWLELEATLHGRDDRRSLPDGVECEKRGDLFFLRKVQ